MEVRQHLYPTASSFAQVCLLSFPAFFLRRPFPISLLKHFPPCPICSSGLPFLFAFGLASDTTRSPLPSGTLSPSCCPCPFSFELEMTLVGFLFYETDRDGVPPSGCRGSRRGVDFFLACWFFPLFFPPFLDILYLPSQREQAASPPLRTPFKKNTEPFCALPPTERPPPPSLRSSNDPISLTRCSSAPFLEGPETSLLLGV